LGKIFSLGARRIFGEMCIDETLAHRRIHIARRGLPQMRYGAFSGRALRTVSSVSWRLRGARFALGIAANPQLKVNA
jgi:hypothetical protein